MTEFLEELRGPFNEDMYRALQERNEMRRNDMIDQLKQKGKYILDKQIQRQPSPPSLLNNGN